MKAVLKYLLVPFVTAVLFYLVFKDQDLKAIWSNIQSANYWWVLLSIGFSIIAHYLRGLRWKLLIGPLGHQAPKNSNAFHAVMIGYLANLAVPRMGEITRCGILNSTDKIPLNELIGTVIVERIMDVIFLLLILGISVLIEYNRIYQFVIDNVLAVGMQKVNDQALLLIAALMLIVVGILVLVLLRKYHEKLMKNNLYAKAFGIFDGLKNGVLSILRLKQKSLFIFYSFAIWLLYILSTYVCFFAIDSTSNLSFGSSVFVMAMGGIGMSAPVQGGIGAYEATVQMALLVYGISSFDGLSYATLNHFSQILSIVLVGSVSLFFIFIVRRKTNHDQRTAKQA